MQIIQVVSIIIFDEENKILTFEHKKNNWKRLVPSGKIEKLEFPLQAAIRELREEIGIEIIWSKLRYIKKKYIYCEKYNNQENGQIFFKYLYRYKVSKEEKEKIKNMEPEKHRNFKWEDKRTICYNPHLYTYETWDSIINYK